MRLTFPLVSWHNLNFFVLVLCFKLRDSAAVNMRNVEIKATVSNLPALLKKAKLLSNSEGTVIHQHDTFFKTPQARLKLRELTQTGDAQLVYYDRPDTEGPKTSWYELSAIPKESVASLKTILDKVLGAAGTVTKQRHLFMVGQTRVHVDEVEGLGSFMELEVVLEEGQSSEEGDRIARDLMDKLGVGEGDLIAGAYFDKLKQWLYCFVSMNNQYDPKGACFRKFLFVSCNIYF